MTEQPIDLADVRSDDRMIDDLADDAPVRSDLLLAAAARTQK